MISKADLINSIYNRTESLNKKVDLIDQLSDSIFRLEVTLQNDCDTVPFLRTVRDALKEDAKTEQEKLEKLQSKI
tara:strand:- start:146 stop:370 length:225 start_codon:yes stop_codon:yes gene_type:complete